MSNTFFFDKGNIELREEDTGISFADGNIVVRNPLKTATYVWLDGRLVASETDLDWLDGSPFIRNEITAVGAVLILVENATLTITGLASKVTRTHITDFSEYSTGSAPDDWTEVWNPGDFTTNIDDSASLISAIGSQYLDFSSVVNSRKAITWDKIGDIADVDIYAKLQAPLSAVGSLNCFIRVYARVSGIAGAENMYCVDIGQGLIRFVKYVDETTTIVESLSAEIFTDPTPIWVRFQIVGSSLKAKVWDGRGAEPYSWLLESTDTELTSGRVGIGSHYVSGDFQLDYFSVSVNGEVSGQFPPIDFESTRFMLLSRGDDYSVSNYIRCMVGQFGDIDKLLKGATVFIGDTHTQQARMAVYSGGSLTTPEGATLLYDFGLTSGSDTETEHILTGANVTIPKNTPLWVIIKHPGSGFTLGYTAKPGGVGNFKTGNTDCSLYVASGMDVDTAVAFPSTIPSITYNTLIYHYDLGAVISDVPNVIEPSNATLTITGQTPTVLEAVLVSVGNAALTITGQTPELPQSGIINVVNATLTITGQTPAVLETVLILAGNATLTITGQTPAVLETVLILAGNATLTLAGQTPTVDRQAPAGKIIFYDSAQAHTSSSSADLTIDLPTLQEDDIVVVVTGGSRGEWPNCGVVSPAGYNEIADLFEEDTNSINLSISWKRMGATPDTTVTCYGPHVTFSDSMGIAYILRGVDPTTAIDAAAVTAQGVNDHDPDPPSITPVTTDAFILIAGGCSNYSASGGDSDVPVPSGYGNQVLYPSINTTNDSTIMVASQEWDGLGAEDPPAWDVDVGTELADAWVAMTVAFRPEAVAESVLIQPPDAELIITGQTPISFVHGIYSPLPATLSIAGQTSIIRTAAIFSVDAAELFITGQEITILSDMPMDFNARLPALSGVLHNMYISATLPELSFTGEFQRQLEFNTTLPEISFTGHFGDEWFMSCNLPFINAEFEGAADIEGNFPAISFDGVLERQRVLSFDVKFPQLDHSGEWAGYIQDSYLPAITGEFDLEREWEGAIDAVLPDLSADFDLWQAPYFPAIAGEFELEGHLYMSFDVKLPHILGSGEGAADIDGNLPSMGGEFTLEQEWFGEINAVLPDLSADFSLWQAPYFPAIAGEFEIEGQLHMSFDVKLPYISGSGEGAGHIQESQFPILSGAFELEREWDGEIVGILPVLTASFNLWQAPYFPAITGEFDLEGQFHMSFDAQLPYLQGDGEWAGYIKESQFPTLSGAFTLEREWGEGFDARLPALDADFEISQAATFAGVIPPLEFSGECDEENIMSFSGDFAPLDGEMSFPLDDPLEFALNLPPIEFTGQMEFEHTMEVIATLPALGAGGFNMTELISFTPTDDGIIRHRRGYDNG